MIKRFFLLSVLAVSFFNQLHSVDIGLEGGVSYFNYAEVGINNKDDLYTINSSLVGITVINSLSFFELKTSLRTQVPFDLIFTDAFGEDENNYLETLIYFGGNFQVSLQYPIVQTRLVKLLLGPVISYDYLYFKDFIVGMDDRYIFSILGFGISQDFLFHFNSKVSFSLSGSLIYNALAIGDRTGDLKWSNNLLITSGLIYSFEN